MNVAYVTTYDARDVRNWSGIARHAGDALERAGLRLSYFGPLAFEEPVAVKVHRLITTRLLRQSYDPERHPGVAKRYALQIDERLERSDADCVLSLGTIPIAFSQCSQRIAFWTDATFAGLTQLYPGFQNASRETLRYGNALEQTALDRCAIAIYASEWAARTASENYRVDPAKIRVVPFGPNRAEDKSAAKVQELIERRPNSPCRLLFLGVDWERKGGPLALEIAAELVRRGVATELHIAGCNPRFEVEPSYVVRHGFIDKNEPSGAAKIDGLLGDSHFLLLPTRAECFGLVFLEASSLGVPSLATDVGGVPSAVRNDRNGRLFSFSAPANEYADHIQYLMINSDLYQNLARSSYEEYSQNLTWDRAATSVRGILGSMVL